MNQPAAAGAIPDYEPVPTNGRHDGWTANRQRRFLETLSETGCVDHASRQAGMSAQSAYRFRLKPEADNFLNAWNDALRLASTRLTSVAFDRALNGVCEETIKDGEVVSTKRRYSDKLLMFLLSHSDALRYGNLSGVQIGGVQIDPMAISRNRMPALLDAIKPEVRTGFGDDGDMAADDNDDPV
ncbi:hypothetical protein [Parasphingorhabdus halotolerans]|uniref:Phage terminase small subunit n=1 Tax=Parasphingorhabdus halotolerans TaxID=2725558 RepID=A0A6H2DSA8_9SPHN|nr:hypothetical protein [Parasphingorhabdus halotolerans]QJB70546.1 hypothetical protein HF685_15845 [Parasphingorhabdus halotolerans]